ncbi:hypothetical protein CWI38_1169p0010, partial [Hamiltosporidium tvaerminnensis]
MSRRKKVDSENIKIEKIKAVNNLENSAGEILMCDVDVAMLSERIPPPPTFHNTTHQPPRSSCQTSLVCLVDTIPSSSGTDATAFGPANGMTNLNTDAILEGNRMMVLHSILDSVTVVEQEWPRSAILENGWLATLRYYNEKFSCTLDIDAETKQEENREICRIAIFLTEQCTFTDTDKIKQISQKKIRKEVVRTRNLPSELVESKVLDLINRIIVARIIQAAQVCYDEATRKEKPRSAWKENIESKISKLKIMREFNLNLSSVTDLSEALVKKNESLNVYEKKIAIHESRKQFRKENRMFELFHGQFYRGLSERIESEHVVSRDEIVSFWSTMWNKMM